MRDNLGTPNVGTPPPQYSREFFERLVRNIELHFTDIKAPGPIRVSEINVGGENLFESGNILSFAALDGTGGNLLPYFTGEGELATTALTVFARTLLAADDADAARTILGAGTGNGDVTGPASATDDNVALFDGTTGKLLKDGFPVSAFARTFLDDADAAAVRTTIGANDASNLNTGTVGNTILPTRLQTVPTSTVTDMNDAVDAGFYRTDSATSNSPVASSGMFLVIAFSAGVVKQLWFRTGTSSDGFERYGSGGTWGTWTRIYNQANAVGTVSQSSGIPTGALVEAGSSANGEYVRFADGTQFCWRTTTLSRAISTASGSIYITTFPARLFAATFIDPPEVFYDHESTEVNLVWVASWTSALATTTEAPGVYLCSNASRATGDVHLKIFAAGRWF